jgi:alpha-tubulin suppressor-like RCC1 family protein
VPAPGDTIRFASVEAGQYHTCGRTPASTAYCWGTNGFAELGTGSAVPYEGLPVAVASQLDIARMSVGEIHTCSLTAAGVAYCWGSDFFGQLGAGAPGPDLCHTTAGALPCSTLPLAVAGGLTFASLTAGWGQTCGVAALGAAYCWGDNANGALGVGADTATLEACFFGPCGRTPLAVTGGLAFATLGAGVEHVCGLTPGGTAYCWGGNQTGQLGIGTDSGPDACTYGPCGRTPAQVTGGRTFTKLSVGYFHSCALATDGAWYCWGSNNSGQLGNGTTGPEICRATYPCSTVPVPVTAGPGFAALFLGRRHSCGVTSVGVAYCWGENVYGELGDGTTANSLTPVAVAGGLTFASVSPGNYHTCGLTTGGVAYCWGYNGSGQLGNGATANSSVPVRVARQVGATTVAASLASMLGSRGSAPPALRPPVP